MTFEVKNRNFENTNATVTLYLDSSALVKLYAEEENREVVFEAVDSSEVVATSTVAYAETRAALARGTPKRQQRV